MSPKLLTGAARAAGSSLFRAQSDARLASLAAAGNAPAFEAIVARYRPELVRSCTRLVGPERAEDAVQQALLNAHVAMPSATIDNLRAWLHRIAHNTAVNVLRSARDETAIHDRIPAPRGLEADLEIRHRLHRALEAIALLPEPQRDALMLRALEGRSHAEIAAALDVTPAAARQTVHRARTTLRAAVTAITPYPLLVRLAGSSPWGGSGSGLPELVAAGGGLATAAKVGTAVIAAGAIAGGAMTIPAREPVHATAKHAPAKRSEARPAAPAARISATPAPATVAPTRLAVSPADDGGRGTGNDDEPRRHATLSTRDDEDREHADDHREDRSGPGDGEHRDEPTEIEDEDADRSGSSHDEDLDVEDVDRLDEVEAEAADEDRSGSGDGAEVLGDELEPEDEDHSGPG